MRTVAAAMGILSMLAFGASAGTGQDKTDTQTGQICLLKVPGMACGACAARVEKTARKIDGVTAVKVSQPKGTAEITYDPTKTTPEAIAKIITKKSGFTAETANTDRKK